MPGMDEFEQQFAGDDPEPFSFEDVDAAHGTCIFESIDHAFFVHIAQDLKRHIEQGHPPMGMYKLPNGRTLTVMVEPYDVYFHMQWPPDVLEALRAHINEAHDE